MLATYDLKYSPASYDVVAFLCDIERRRLEVGHDKIFIDINPGPNNGFRRDNLWPKDIYTRIKMLQCVVVPMMRMLPSVRSVHTLEKRQILDEYYGFDHGIYGLKVQIDAMSRGIRPLRPPVGLIDQPKNLVTVTLRDAPHWYQRNSNRPEWLDACNGIRNLGYEVLIIPDTFSNRDHVFGDHNIYWDAADDLDVRARIYKSAVCNLFVSNGPAWFALALDVSVLMVKPITENLMKTCSAEYFESCGIPIGGQIPSSPAYQRLAWVDDTADNILTSFFEYMEANA
jgi:hypothetical protein